MTEREKQVIADLTEETAALCETLNAKRMEVAEDQTYMYYRLGDYGLYNSTTLRKAYLVPRKTGVIRRSCRMEDAAALIENKAPKVYNLTNLKRWKRALKDELYLIGLYQSGKFDHDLIGVGKRIEGAGRNPFKRIPLTVLLYRMSKRCFNDAPQQIRRQMIDLSETQALVKTGMLPSKLSKTSTYQNAVLFIATNGGGLGHLTRCLSIARQLQKKSPDTAIIFLTNCLALTHIQRAGFVPYCLPPQKITTGVNSTQWNSMMLTMLTDLTALYPIRAFVFDGAGPYSSIISSIAKKNGIPWIWVKRGGEKSQEIAERRMELEQLFDLLIIPKETSGDQTVDDERHIYVDPILFLNHDELWSREEVRTFLHVSPDEKLVYIQLGAGNINDIQTDLGKIVKLLKARGNVKMVIGESIIGSELKIVDDDIIILKDYPNSKYLNGFDFAVSACGYNSFHEMLFNAVPTLFIPNMQTATDDQYGRAMIAQNVGCGIVVTENDEEHLDAALSVLCDNEKNAQMRKAAAGTIGMNGADKAAEIICRYIPENHE